MTNNTNANTVKVLIPSDTLAFPAESETNKSIISLLKNIVQNVSSTRINSIVIRIKKMAFEAFLETVKQNWLTLYIFFILAITLSKQIPFIQIIRCSPHNI
jgi:hypothetical protein